MRIDPPLSECLSILEMAAELGCSDQHLYNMLGKYPDAPAPLRQYGKTRVYYWPHFRQWAMLHDWNLAPVSRPADSDMTFAF